MSVATFTHFGQNWSTGCQLAWYASTIYPARRCGGFQTKRKKKMTNGYFFEHLVLAYTIVVMNDLGLINLLEIPILTLSNFIKLPVSRYLGMCNVLYI